MTKRFLSKTHRVFLTLVACLIVNIAMAQVPQIINYQGVALNASGTPVANSTISLQFTIAKVASSSYQTLYEEDRQVTTDAAGLFDVQIGDTGATNIYGSIQNVINSDGTIKLYIKMDVNGGTNLISIGSQQLVSVPFAFRSTLADSLILPYVGNDNTINSFVVNNTYNGAGVAIKGTSFNNNTNAVGLYGVVPIGNTLGTGVRGQAFANGALAIEGVNTGGGVAIRGKATGATGVAVYAENTNASGKALDVNGNVKIAGGNTNPSAGAVLTSDANGNAIWKNQKIGFAAKSPGQLINHASVTTLSFNQVYDASGNFNPAGAATDPNTFIAPVSGLYHFSTNAYFWLYSLTDNLEYATIYLKVNGVDYSMNNANQAINTSVLSEQSVEINSDIYLNAGDKVTVAVRIENSASTSAPVNFAYFSGHLIFAD